MTNKPDPNKITVQLNVPVSWQFLEDLNQIAADLKQSRASLVREAIASHLQEGFNELERQRVLEARMATQ